MRFIGLPIAWKYCEPFRLRYYGQRFKMKGVGLSTKPNAKLDVDAGLVRNIGIIAHIDAGKTTVTERILYIAGATKTMGDVDSGDTVTDYMDLERERGITIQSAAISLFWNGCRINLIDTPGHVDFSLEVERCVRVLDGAVTVLDASAGVEAQTVTVWRQANKFRLPSVFFVNKMDKKGADFQMCIDSVQSILSMKNTIPVSLPTYSEDGKFEGVLDLISKRFVNCDVGDGANWEDVPLNSVRYEKLMLAREEMLSRLADVDEHFANLLLSTPSTEGPQFEKIVCAAVRRGTVARTLVPIACGTALRCAASARPVLDMVSGFLPAPNQRNQSIRAIFGDDLSALVFKIGHDKRRGQLSYVRVYTGELRNGATVYNANRGVNEHRLNLFLPHSDLLLPLDAVKGGNIAVVTGLESTVTGDTLLASESAMKSAVKRRRGLAVLARRGGECTSKPDDEMIRDEISVNFESVDLCETQEISEPTELAKAILLAGIDSPDPVFFCSIEPPAEASRISLEKALKELSIEDPSMRVRTDTETGQTVIEGMGELHIEVIKARLQREYDLNVFLGPLQIGYREVIEGAVRHTENVVEVLGENKMRHECTITLEIVPTAGAGKFKKVKVALEDAEVPFIRADWLKAINDGCATALQCGPVMGYPVQEVGITVRGLITGGGRTNPAIICAAANKCVLHALLQANARLVEPIMRLEVTIADTKGRSKLSGILQEVARRRGDLVSIEGDEEESGRLVRVLAMVPLAELMGASAALRSVTSGLATLHMQLHGYAKLSSEVQNMVTAKLRGTAK